MQDCSSCIATLQGIDGLFVEMCHDIRWLCQRDDCATFWSGGPETLTEDLFFFSSWSIISVRQKLRLHVIKHDNFGGRADQRL